jgi:capsular polysaccharide biosynthesis protein
VSLASCWRSVLRNWYLLVVCALVASGTTLYLTHRATREYRSSLRLAAGPSPALTEQTRIVATVDSLNKRSLITTFAEIVGARKLFRAAATEVGLSAAEASRYSVTSVALPEANVVGLDVQGPRRSVTAALADAIASRAIAYIGNFYKDFSLRKLDDPSTPGDPVTPKPKRDVPLAAAGGLCLGFFLGLGRDYVEGRRKRRDGREPEHEES